MKKERLEKRDNENKMENQQQLEHQISIKRDKQNGVQTKKKKKKGLLAA